MGLVVLAPEPIPNPNPPPERSNPNPPAAVPELVSDWVGRTE
jgi:hypothetical protein